jgi:transposase InsO family protein
MTYIWTAQGWLYLAVMLDLFSRRVVGWAMSERIDRQLALDALGMALARRRPPRGLIHHSDRGSQTGFKRSSQHYVLAHRRYWFKASAGVFHPRALRGLELRSSLLPQGHWHNVH